MRGRWLWRIVGFVAIVAVPRIGVIEAGEPAAADPWIVDFRFAPERWQTAICLPDDWQKSLVGRQGDLLYGYPGRFDGFKLRILSGLAGQRPQWLRQELLSPRVPIVRTFKQAGPIAIEEQAFAVAPLVAQGQEKPKPPSLAVERLDPEGDLINWASPKSVCDPGFADIAVGFRKAIRYRFPAKPGERFTVVFGLCEGYHAQPGRRILELRVEGKARRTVDMVAEHGQNVPAAIPFEAGDENGDGWIDLAVLAAPNSPDRNAVLSLFWVSSGPAPSAEEIAGGRSRNWLLRFDCGSSKSQGQAPRHELLIVRMRNTGSAPATVRPQITLLSEFSVQADDSRRQVAIGPSTSLRATETFKLNRLPKDAWTLEFDARILPPGQEHAIALGLMHGEGAAPLPGSVPEAVALRDRAVAWWKALDLPYGRIEVPDAGIQALVDSSIRNIYQAREIKNGLPAFQVGPTVYRGLWVVDGSFLMEAIAFLGKTEEARNGIRYLLSFQRSDGAIQILERHWKETGIALWAVTRHARLTNDKAWLNEVWPKVEAGLAHIRRMRNIEEAADPQAPNYRLVPNGFSDGGLGGSFPEYTNIYWTLNGLAAAIDAARWLGRTEEAAGWQKEFDDFMAAFRKAAQRDTQVDAAGNRYVPTRMRGGEGLTPQRGQWAFLHTIFPGKLFANDDPLMRGNLAMLRAAERQGLVYGTSVPHAIWGYLGSFYAHDWLWLGQGEKASRVLYAFANHASPLLVWREEQVPVGESDPRNFGDMPHNWASAEFIRLVRHLLVLERGDELHLLEGLPAAWVRPGAMIRLQGVLTEFGPISLELKVSADGRSAALHVDPPRRNPPSRLVLHLGQWASPVSEQDSLPLSCSAATDLTLALKPKP